MCSKTAKPKVKLFVSHPHIRMFTNAISRCRYLLFAYQEKRAINYWLVDCSKVRTITSNLRSVQVKVSQRLNTETCDPLSDMTPARVKPLSRGVKPLKITGLTVTSPSIKSMAAELVVSTHSPGFPPSTPDLIPSPEGSFPKDSRICQVWDGLIQETHIQKILASQILLNRIPTFLIYFFFKVQLSWHQEIHPELSLSVFPSECTCSTQLPRVDTVHSAPPPLLR